MDRVAGEVAAASGGKVLRSSQRFRREESVADSSPPADPFGLLAIGTLAALVLLAPYPWGAYLPAGIAKVQALAFASLALALVSSASLSPLRPLRLPLAFGGGLLLLGLLQLVSLPEAVLRALSPASLRIWQEAGQLAALDSLGAPRPRISIAPSETRQALLLLAAYASTFVAAACLGTTRARRRVLVGSILLAALVQIGHALLGPREGLMRLHGSFVNPNHYAGYLEVGLGLAAGAVWWASRHARVSGKEGELEQGLLSLVPTVLLLGAIAAGLGLSGSRGAVVGVLLAGLWFLPMTYWQRNGASRPSRRADPRDRERPAGRSASALLAMLAPFVAALLFAASITGRTPVLRFLDSDPRDLGAEGRFQLWRVSREVFRDHALVGSGLGTFREAFRRRQPRELSGFVEQAHSEPLQLLVTGGVAGGVLGLGALSSFAAAFLSRLRRQRHREESAVALGSLAAFFALLVHGLFEFNFSLPAIPATLAVALGVGWAAMVRPDGPGDGAFGAAAALRPDGPGDGAFGAAAALRPDGPGGAGDAAGGGSTVETEEPGRTD